MQFLYGSTIYYKILEIAMLQWVGDKYIWIQEIKSLSLKQKKITSKWWQLALKKKKKPYKMRAEMKETVLISSDYFLN